MFMPQFLFLILIEGIFFLKTNEKWIILYLFFISSNLFFFFNIEILGIDLEKLLRDLEDKLNIEKKARDGLDAKLNQNTAKFEQNKEEIDRRYRAEEQDNISRLALVKEEYNKLKLHYDILKREAEISEKRRKYVIDPFNGEPILRDGERFNTLVGVNYLTFDGTPTEKYIEEWKQRYNIMAKKYEDAKEALERLEDKKAEAKRVKELERKIEDFAKEGEHNSESAEEKTQNAVLTNSDNKRKKNLQASAKKNLVQEKKTGMLITIWLSFFYFFPLFFFLSIMKSLMKYCEWLFINI